MFGCEFLPPATAALAREPSLRSAGDESPLTIYDGRLNHPTSIYMPSETPSYPAAMLP
jgi:hypothetical protein